MLLRLCTVVVVVVVCMTEGRAAQSSQQQAAAVDGKTTLLQLAAPVAQLSAQLKKRNAKGDNSALATGFVGGHLHGHHHNGHHLGHGHHGHGKFFMYAHQPEHKHYEFGFKRGNDKHVVERYEKGGPHHNFKSKFRWHDKHGGHGERYWDYNHGPHYHDGSGGGGDDDGGHHGYHSEPVPEFVQPGSTSVIDPYRQRRKIPGNEYEKKSSSEKKPTLMEKKIFVGPKEQQELHKNPLIMSNPNTPQASSSGSESAFNEMLGYDPFAPPEILKDHSSLSGTIVDESSTLPYRYQPTTLPPPSISKPYFNRKAKEKTAKPMTKPSDSGSVSQPSEAVPQLAFDLDSGRVFNEKTGKWFRLVAD